MISPDTSNQQTSKGHDIHHENSHACVRKRTRASTEQLSVLESTFAKNVSPNSKYRKQLAEKLQMNERSIQIWFQNRRAKVKHIQKKAQMQMQQAAIQAQLQHYHQQQYNMMTSLGVGHPPSMSPLQLPLYPHCQYQQLSPPQQQPFYFPPLFAATTPLTRAQSMDDTSYRGSSMSDVTTVSSIPTPRTEPYITFKHENQGCTSSFEDSGAVSPTYTVDSPFRMPSRSMPPLNSLSHTLTSTDMQTNQKSPIECAGSHEETLAASPCQDNFPGYVLGQITPSQSPRARSFSPCYNSSCFSSSFINENKSFETSKHNEVTSTKEFYENSSPLLNTAADKDALNNNSTLNTIISQVSPLSTSEEDTTVNPSSLVLASSYIAEVSQNQHLSAATLTIGAWLRVNMSTSDLACSFEIHQKAFVWVINEGGGQFKIEMPLAHIANIECLPSFGINNEPTTDVNFYLSRCPLFYMESSTEHGNQWVQCSDFTENNQASRYLRHALKGPPELKQELANLIHSQQGMKNIVRFIETQYDVLRMDLSVSPTKTPILPSQNRHSTIIVPSVNYYPIGQYSY